MDKISKVIVDSKKYDVKDSEARKLLETFNNTKANKTDIGSPLVATSVSDMKDTSKIYVYVGSEIGYTKGNWYYYDASNKAWKSGGIYNSTAVETDKTLTQSNVPADSKTVGDKIAEVREQFNTDKTEIDNKLEEMQSIYQTTGDMYAGIESMHSKVVEESKETKFSTLQAMGYANAAKEIKDAIEEMTPLTPEVIKNTEVQLARGGRASLNTRLNMFAYKYDKRDEMLSDVCLRDGDIAMVFGGEALNDGHQRVFKVVELESPESILVEDEWYELSAPAVKEGYHMYAYSIGGFGTGSGTGGDVSGIRFELQGIGDTVHLEVGSSLDIPFIYKSGNLSGTLYYSTNGFTYSEMVLPSAGSYSIHLPEFKNQVAVTLRMYIVDAEGNMSETKAVVIRVGDLSATVSTTITEYTDQDDLSIKWKINDIYGVGITSHISLYRNNTLVREESQAGVVGGNNSYNFGKLVAGHYTFKVYLTNDNGNTSKTDSLVFNVSSDKNIATYFVNPPLSFNSGVSLAFSYALLFNGTGSFKTKVMLDGVVVETIDAYVGENNTVVLSPASVGYHAIRLITESADGSMRDDMTHNFEISETSGSVINVISDGLVVDLDSRFKTNNKADKNTWADNQGTITAELLNFDYNTNGWTSAVVDNDTTSIVLKTNGYDNYVKANFCPFYSSDLSMVDGMVVEIKFKANDMGDENATILECLDLSNKGFKLTTSKAIFNPFGSIEDSKSTLTVNLVSDEWTRVSFIVAKGSSKTGAEIYDYNYYTDEDLAMIAVNGTIMAVVAGDIDGKFAMNSRFPMYIGAHYNSNLGYTQNYANCEIQHIRVYNQKLNANEVLNNFIADLHNLTLQQFYMGLNDYNNSGEPGKSAQTSLPSLVIDGCDLKTMDIITEKDDKGVPLAKKYSYPNVDVILTDPTGALGLPGNQLIGYGCTIKGQGTSSMNYKVKNYKVTYYKYNKHMDTSDIIEYNGSPLTPESPNWNPSGMYIDKGVSKYVGDGTKTKASKKKVVPNVNDGWLPENTFCLKADYMESSHTRNTGNATFLQSYMSRNLPPQQANENNPYYNETGDYQHVQCSISGFPVVVSYRTLDGETIYKGIYNFNIDKGCSDHFGFKRYNEEVDEDNPEDMSKVKCLSYEMANNESGGAAGFNKDSHTADGIRSIQTDFEVRYHPYEDTGALNDEGFLNINSDGTSTYHQALINLIDWVYATKGNPEMFKAQVTKHFDIETLRRYYIYTRTMSLADNLGKNCMLTTWNADEENIVRNDDGSIDWENSTFAIWYPQFYDMDTCIGLDNVGNNIYGVTHDIHGHTEPGIPSDDQITFNTSDSVLWCNLEDTDFEGIQAEYLSLRQTILTPERVLDTLLGKIVNKIGQYYYNLDTLAKYFGLLSDYDYMAQGSGYSHIKNWITKRFAYIDSVFGYGTSTIIFRNYKRADQESTNVNFGIKVAVPQYITVQYADNITETKLCTPDLYTVFSKVITSSDSNMTISGKEYITELTGLAQCNVMQLNFNDAKRLRKLDLSGCGYLTDLTLGNNYWLREIDLTSTAKLTSELDISTLNELIKFTAKGSGITGLTLHSGYGRATNLKQINIQGAPVANLNADTVTNIISIGTIDLTSSDYNTYAKLENWLNSWNISEEHRQTLFDQMKSQLLESNVPASEVNTYTSIKSIYDNARNSFFTDMFVPGLVMFKPVASMEVIDLNGNNLIDAVYINPVAKDSGSSRYPFATSEIDLSYMDNLKYLYLDYATAPAINVSGNTKLYYVYMNNLTGVAVLNLSDIKELIHLYTPNCNSLETIIMNYESKALKTLNLSYCSKLSLMKFGNSDTTTKGMNLSRYELTSVNFQTLLAMPTITNLKATLTSLGSVFYNDWRYTNTVTTNITGTITITGTSASISQAFYGFANLIFNFGNSLKIELAEGARFVGSAYRAIYNCKKFTYNDLLYIMERLGYVTSFQEAFVGDTGIVTNTLPATLFCGTIGTGHKHPVTDIQNMFGSCNGMKNLVLPSGIFDPLVNVTTMSNWCYSSTTKAIKNPTLSNNVNISDSNTSINVSNISGTIPSGLFDKMIKLQTITNLFAGSSITVGNINTLFSKNTALTSMQRVFAGATLNLTVQPTKEMFKGLTKLINITGLFRGSNINFGNGNIPSQFLSYLTNLANASYLFCGCEGITGMGDGDFIRNNGKLSDLSFMLAKTGLTGSIPENLLPDALSSSRNLTGMFYGNANLGNYTEQRTSGVYSNDIPGNIFKGQTNVTSIAYMFGNCPELSIDLNTGDYWFDDMRNLLNISGLFYHDLGLHNSIPAYGYMENLADFYEPALDEDGQIMYDPTDPTKMIMNYKFNENRIGGLFACKNEEGEFIDSPIIYGANIFNTCSNLNGAIPGNIFSKMSSVITFANCFYYCKRIGTLSDSTVHGTSIVQVPNRHFAYGLFDDCSAITNLSGMFAYCRFNGKSEEKATIDLDDNVYDENYALPRYFFRFCTKLEDVSSMFTIGWTSSEVSEENEDYYISDMYGSIYPFLFSYNENLTRISAMFNQCNHITGYKTATSTNGVDSNLFSNNKYIQYMDSAFHGTRVGMVERGLILLRNQISALKNVTNVFSPGTLQANYGATGIPVGKQIVYDINDNKYKSFYDVYGIYAVSSAVGY